jgi:hypothetical protein
MTGPPGPVRFVTVLLCAAVCFQPAAAADPPEPPYPSSPLIAAVEWAPEDEIIRRARGSDTFPITRGDDGHLYTAYADGWGFEPLLPKKLSLGVARVEGFPPDFRGVNIRSPIEEAGDGRRGRKASGMLMVDGRLYMWLRNADRQGRESQLVWSEDRGRTWTEADWRFERFGYPTFLNFGRNYTGARDDFVYVYSHDNPSAYEPADRFILMRVPSDRIGERDAYELFAGLDAGPCHNHGQCSKPSFLAVVMFDCFA